MTGNVEREKDDPNPTTRPLRNFTLPSSLKWGHQKHLCCMKLDNSSGDHTEEDDDSNRKLMTNLRTTAVHIGERERPDVVNNGDKKPYVEEVDSNPRPPA
nr:DUF1639 domain-containing protein [Ipomoea batatas]